MAWKSGFFNSVNGDRTYNADQMSAIFSGLISDGVYEAVGNKLAVQPNNGMVIQINTGRGWFNGRWVDNDSIYSQTLEAADVLLNRYCAVCIRVDTSDGVRSAEPYFKYSDFATNPVKPSMTRTETIKEYCLAYVYIKAGATSITAADIEDTRSNNSLCGWVTGLIKQLDTTTLYEQWEGVFFDWFNNLEEYLDPNVEAKLVNDVIDLKTKVTKTHCTLIDSNWVKQSSGAFQQTVTINGVTADSDIIVAPVNENKEHYVDMNCEAVSTGTNSITFECDRRSSYGVDVYVEIIILNLDTIADVVTESVSTFTVTDDGKGAVTISD